MPQSKISCSHEVLSCHDNWWLRRRTTDIRVNYFFKAGNLKTSFSSNLWWFFAAIEGLKSQILVEKFTKSSFSEVLMLDSQRDKFLSFSEVILLNFNSSWIINWFFLLWGLCPFLISQKNKILRNNKLPKGLLEKWLGLRTIPLGAVMSITAHHVKVITSARGRGGTLFR